MELDEAEKEIRKAIDAGELCLMVGSCKVRYEGRAASKLSEGDRLVVIKHDGTFLVHQSTKMAAINYQGPGSKATCRLEYDANNRHEKKPVSLTVSAVRTLANGAAERIDCTFRQVYSVSRFKLKDDEKLQLFGSERELSNLLMQDLHLIEKGLTPLQQESDVRKGSIDILAQDANGKIVAIELKRRDAGLDAVTQLARYVKELSKRRGQAVRGVLCSPHVTPNALKMLEQEGLEYYKLDYEIANPSAKIRGLQKKQKSLTEFGS